MRFFRNFIALPLTLAAALALAAADFAPLELRFASPCREEQEIREFFRQLDAQIYYFCGTRDLGCTIIFEPASGTPKLKLLDGPGNSAQLQLCGNWRDIRRSPGVLFRIMGVMAQARMGRRVEPERAAMPDWVGAAILNKLDDNLTFTRRNVDGTLIISRVFRPYRDLSGLRLLLTYGTLPDFSDWCEVKIATLPPVTREVFIHYSRFLLDELGGARRREQLVGDYLAALADGMESRAALEGILGRGLDDRAEKYLKLAGQNAAELGAFERRRRYLTMRAHRAGFNANYLYNPTAGLRRLEELRRVWYCEQSPDGEFTGKLASCDLTELPELLKKHPDGSNIWRFKVAEFVSFRQRVGPTAAPAVRELEKVLSGFPDYFFSSGKREIASALQAVAAAFGRQEQQDGYVLDAELELLPARLAFARELAVESYYSDVEMSDEIRELLDAVARRFGE